VELGDEETKKQNEGLIVVVGVLSNNQRNTKREIPLLNFKLSTT
jgi:hypothetical protein